MAAEIRYNMSVALVNGSLTDTYNTSGLTADQASARLVRNVQTLLSASAQGDQIELGGVVAPGMAVFANLDSVNFLELGIQVTGTFYPFLKLLAGQQAGPMFLGITAPNLYGRADTGNIELFYVIYDT